MIDGQKTLREDILEQTRRILTQTGTNAPLASAQCCTAAKQEVCCEPSEKSSCCGSEATAGGGCGCQ